MAVELRGQAAHLTMSLHTAIQGIEPLLESQHTLIAIASYDAFRFVHTQRQKSQQQLDSTTKRCMIYGDVRQMKGTKLVVRYVVMLYVLGTKRAEY